MNLRIRYVRNPFIPSNSGLCISSIRVSLPVESGLVHTSISILYCVNFVRSISVYELYSAEEQPRVSHRSIVIRFAN
ncbi:unnamed protein product [Peniophora sp. CBMAI 1063]|nr:unnamed protein product [Peniophora sp. CBMAI 1063]